MESGEEVLDDLDTTLDELIVNAHTLREIQQSDRFKTEAEALEKTQESLLARILYRQQLLDEKRKLELTQRAAEKEALIDQKIEHFAKINTELPFPVVSALKPKRFKRRPLKISRRRTRSLARSILK